MIRSETQKTNTRACDVCKASHVSYGDDTGEASLPLYRITIGLIDGDEHDNYGACRSSVIQACRGCAVAAMIALRYQSETIEKLLDRR